MRLSQDKIYRRYCVIRKITLWTELSILLALPLVGIMMYVWEYILGACCSCCICHKKVSQLFKPSSGLCV